MTPLKRNLLIGLAVVGVALGGSYTWIMHVDARQQDITAYEGTHPKLDEPDAETIPSVGLVRTAGWQAGEAPKPADGLTVSRFAEGLQHPRTMLVLPNADVLVAETNGPPRPRDERGIKGFFFKLFQKRAGAATGAFTSRRLPQR